MPTQTWNMECRIVILFCTMNKQHTHTHPYKHKWDVFFRKMKNLNRLDIFLFARVYLQLFFRSFALSRSLLSVSPTFNGCACVRCMGAMQKPNMNNILSYLSTKPNDLFMGPFAVRTQNIWIIQLVPLVMPADVKWDQQATQM